jgi:hypothetical protein
MTLDLCRTAPLTSLNDGAQYSTTSTPSSLMDGRAFACRDFGDSLIAKE